MFYQFVYVNYIKTSFEPSSKIEALMSGDKLGKKYEVTFTYPDAKLTNCAISVPETDDKKSVIKVNEGEKYGPLPAPVKDNYVFSGWYTSEYGGERILSNNEVELTENQTLYARWVTEEEASLAELPILMYHWFYEEGKEEYGMLSNGNWMSIEEFRSHMEYLNEEEYYYPSWEEVEQFASGVLVLPEKSVVVNIDDGKDDFFSLAIPVLEEYDINATGFLITSKIKDTTPARYSSDNIDLRSHSHDMHIRQSNGRGVAYNMKVYEMVDDLHRSKEKLGQGYVFCYPFGHYSDDLKEALNIEGYRLAVTIENGKVRPGTDKLQLPRVRISSGITVEMFQKLIEKKES